MMPKLDIQTENFIDTVPTELEKDTFSTLVLQGGTNEVSNLDVSGNVGEKIETLKEEIRASSVKLFEIAEDSLKENSELKKVIILKRMFRCDTIKADPSQIKEKLSEFGNRVLDDLWLSKGCPKNIVVAQQHLEFEGNLRIQRFGLPSAKNYDGIHMRGKMAVQHYTGSLINILLNNLPNLNGPLKTPVNISQQQSQPPRTFASVLKTGLKSAQPKLVGRDVPASGDWRVPVGQNVQSRAPGVGKNRNINNYQYNIPTSNMFSNLGNFAQGN